MVGMKAILANIPFDDYKALKLKLFHQDKSMTTWIREQVTKELSEGNFNTPIKELV